MFRDFDMQRGGTWPSSVHPGPLVWPEPWDPFRITYEGVRRDERGGYEGPPAEPVPRCVRPPPGFEGTEPAEGGYHGRPSIAGKYQLFCEPHPRAGTAPGESTSRSVPHVQTEKPNRKDAEVPPVKRRISEPASQGQGKKRGKKPGEPKSRTERPDQTPRNRTERPDQNSRKRNERTAEITERREQEAELVQHAPTQPKKRKHKLTLAALTFTREQWAQLSRQKRKRYANWRNRLRRGEQQLKNPVTIRDEDKSTKVHSQSVVESDLNRAGEDHPQ